MCPRTLYVVQDHPQNLKFCCEFLPSLVVLYRDPSFQTIFSFTMTMITQYRLTRGTLQEINRSSIVLKSSCFENTQKV